MTTSGASEGQFTYNPPAGFTGTDTFTYTITNSHGSSTATVSLPISGIIWFINNNAVSGDGRIGSPFNSLASFQAINFYIDNTTGTLDRISFSNTTIGHTQASSDDNDGIQIAAGIGTTTLNVTADHCTFTGAAGDVMNVGAAAGSVDLIFTNNTVTNNFSGSVAGGVTFE